MGINARDKGQRAERAAVKLLQPIVDRLTTRLGIDAILIERNQQQTNKGGYDLIGLDWLALEIKHQEKLQVEQWWQQCLRQARTGQEPVLMYKQNNIKWRVRMHGAVYVVDWYQDCVTEISLDDFLPYFEHRSLIELSSRAK